jgi:hypothetical protein
MERRRALKIFGGAIVTGKTVASVKKPALGVDFSISDVESADPSNVNNILIKFGDLYIKPQFLDESEPLDITVGIYIDKSNEVSKKAKNINFTNGEIISLYKIQNRSNTDLSKIFLDGLNYSESSISGTVNVRVNHPEIDVKTYEKRFNIIQSNIIVDNFNDGDINEYYGSNAFGIESNTVISGNYAINGSGNNSAAITSNVGDGLPYYPNFGDVIRWNVYFKSSGFSQVSPFDTTIPNNNAPRDSVVVHENQNRIELRSDRNTVSNSKPVELSQNTWYIVEADTTGSEDIARIYDINGDKLATVKDSNVFDDREGISWSWRGGASGVTDFMRII